MVAALTKAQRRALNMGACGKGVRIAGGYGGSPQPGLWRQPDFDRRSIIERLVARGLMAPTDAFNTYRTTEAGAALLRRRRPQQQQGEPA